MLSNTTIIRAWRDKTFRASLSQEQMQNMPEHPCGIIELSDDSLRNVAGGTTHFSCDSTPASTCFDSSCGGGGGGGGMSAYFAGGVCCM